MRSLIGLILISLCSGCAITSTEQRAALLTGGAGVGALAGNELGHGDKRAAVAGGVAGAGLSALALGPDPVVAQSGYDQGYVQGQSDAIKRHYEMRMRAHHENTDDKEDGATAYYIVPGPTKTNDGRELEPHEVAIPIKE